ncbi:hypothetical protein B0H19DRAFT_1274615 [Mycena capillaripes]|nr:hypothetical protein B0H19DRAFT_1274615 [Mycena capillaripes]
MSVSRNSAVDTAGAPQSDGTKRSQQSRSSVPRTHPTPHTHPTPRVACLTGILSPLMPGVFVGVQPHLQVAFVGTELEAHSHVTFVIVHPHLQIAFVDFQAHRHSVFVGAAAFPHPMFVQFLQRPRLAFVGTTRVFGDHGTTALSSEWPIFSIPLFPSSLRAARPRLCLNPALHVHSKTTGL